MTGVSDAITRKASYDTPVHCNLQLGALGLLVANVGSCGWLIWHKLSPIAKGGTFW